MRVAWTEFASLSSIPEMYWGEDLSKLDRDHQGEVIGSVKSFWGTTYLVVACDDGEIREVDIDNAKQIGHEDKKKCACKSQDPPTGC